MAVVTIAGSLGSGAMDVASLAASRLGMDYVDREILVEASGALGVGMEAVERRDERPSTFGERLAGLLRNFLERSATAGAGDPMMGGGSLEILLSHSYGEAASLPAASEEELDEKTYISTISAIIQDLAEKGGVVILGRGSQIILRDWPATLHAYVTAPLELRIERVGEREGVSAEEAAKTVHESDKNRLAFYHKFFKIDVDDPNLYDLVVNTANLSYEAAADLVAAAARSKEPPPG
jgi:cytidylate kinase